MLRRLAALLVTVSLASGCTFFDKVLGGGPDPADYVSGKKYAKLVVEVDYPAGYEPTPLALSTLEAAIKEVAGKSSVVVKRDDGTVPVETNRKYSNRDLDALHERFQDQKTGGDTAVLHVLFVAGGHADDTQDGRVLGLSSPGGYIVMLKGNIRASSSGGVLGIGGVKEENVERAVLVHEFGHAAGLVNLGAPMQTNHEDGQNRGHSLSKASVMYWAVESSLGLQELLNGGSSIPYQFDANDKADLRALREQ